MRTLAVIPARLGAVRLPLKPLRLLAGEPLVVRVWERVSEMRIADACVVATDDPSVVEAVTQAAGDAVLTSPAHRSGTERIAEVAALPRFADFGTVINVQGDEPFITRSAIAGAAELVTSGRFDIGTAAAKASMDILTNPNVVKVVTADDGSAMYFSRAPIPFLRDRGGDDSEGIAVLQHIGVYAYSRAALFRWAELPVNALEQVEKLEQLRPLAAGLRIGISVTAEAPSAGVDTEAELAEANARWQEFIAGAS